MTIVNIIFWIVVCLWGLVAGSACIVIRDIMRPRPPLPPPPMPLQIGTWFDNIAINQRDRGRYWYDARDGGMRWRATEPEDLMMRVPLPPLTPETERALQILNRARDTMIAQCGAEFERALVFGSQAFQAINRCDICGASTAEQKTERCRNACGQIHGGQTTAVLCVDASAWTGRSDGRGGLRISRRNDLRGPRREPDRQLRLPRI